MKSLLAGAACAGVLLGVPVLGNQVVINEIMYHPSSEDAREEYIELLNHGTNAVDLHGWRFSRGVDFTFTNVTLAPGQLLVVAADLAAFQALYPNVTNVVGGWTGRLANSGEDIELEDTAGARIDLVPYSDEGDWALRVRGPLDDGHRGWEWYAEHDGLGRSLELINAALPNDLGPNWSASLAIGGSPGTTNLAASANVAPLLSEVGHLPASPRSTEPVTVTALVLDELTNGVAVTLFYRDASSVSPLPFTGTTMFDNGQNGDGTAGDRVFTVTLPPQTNGAVIEFYVRAVDGSGNARTWPAPALDEFGTPGQWANAIYQVDDTVYGGSQPIYRIIFTGTERDEYLGIPPGGGESGTDAQFNATFVTIDGAETKTRYLCGARIRGAGSRSRIPRNFRVNIPHDALWNGVSEINLNTQYGYLQTVGSHLVQKSGLVAADARLVQVRVNALNLAGAGSPQFGSYAAVEVINADWAAAHLPDDPEGNIYRGSTGNHSAYLLYLGNNPSSYLNRGYSKSSNTSEDDWTDLFDVTFVLSQTNNTQAEYATAIRQAANVELWMRYLALYTLMVSMETSLATGRGDDYAMYRGVNDPRFILLPHDLDTIFGQGDTTGNPTTSIFRMVPAANAAPPQHAASNVTNWNRFVWHPEFTPIYYAELKRLIETTFSPEQLFPLLDRLLTGAVPPDNIAAMKNFAAARNAFVLSQIPTNITFTTNLPVVSGYLFTPAPAALLAGSANVIETRTILVNGVTSIWNHVLGRWTNSAVPLLPGINRVLVQSLDASGAEIDRAQIDVWRDTGAATDISGTLVTDLTLDAAAGPYSVTGTLNVPAGVTLTLGAGTSVYFAAGAGMLVNGALVAEGTETSRIRLTRTPGAGTTNSWNGINIQDASGVSRISHADLEFAGSGGHSIEVENSTLLADHLTFRGTTRTLIELDNASLHVRDSVFPDIAGAEHIHGGPMPPGGFVIIERNVFGTSTLLNDIIDFTGAQRPGPVLQVLDNVFLGSTDDVLDLDGTDAHIEGNIFLHVHKNNPNVGDTASAISYGENAGYGPHIVAVRNLFFDVDHIALVKEGGFLTLVNNTAVGINIAAVNFSEPERGTVPGFGAALDGNIFWNPTGWSGTNFQNHFPANGTVTLTALRNIFGSSQGVTNGVNANLVTDPRLNDTRSNYITARTITDAFRLLSGSPARGTGPNGLDRGGLVPPGASLSGEPPAMTTNTSATFTVGGPSISNYVWRLNGGVLSAELPVSAPIALTGLANGGYTVEVFGRNDAGVMQTNPTVSRSWTVDTALAKLVLNEVLARNDATLQYGDGYPDLIELHNAGAAAVDLSGWGITDDPTNKFKFTFPPGTSIASGQHLVLYAANPEGVPGFFLGFGLDAAGDSVHLYDAGGTLVDAIEFGTQLADLSIGRLPDGAWGLTRPTFGAANVAEPVGETRTLRINEWLAAGAPALPDDFIELFNPDPLPVDLGGLYLSDAPQGTPDLHRIPERTFIAGRGYFVFLADGNPEQGLAHLGFKLGAEQGEIGLAAPDLSLIDCVFYGPQSTGVSEGRQPDGAATFGFITPPTPGVPNPVPLINCTIVDENILLVPTNQTWRYNRSGLDQGTVWRAPGFDDSGWLSGQALIGRENDTPFPYAPAPFNTSLNSGYNQSVITYYFRAHFTVSSNLSGLALRATTFIDDGAVFYLNGTEVGRVRLTANPVLFDTRAGNATDGNVDMLEFPAGALIVGDNVLAVEVHQASANSSDVMFGVSLRAVRSITNCVAFNVVLNEVMADNRSRTNADGSITDWVEIYNPSATTIDLSDASLTDNVDEPRRWVFPSGVSLAPGGYLVVHCSGTNAPSTNAAGPLHTGFGLRASGDEVFLFDAPARGGGQIDSIAFGLQVPDLTIGRAPNGSGAWRLNQPTRGSVNIEITALGSPFLLRINEWMANPRGNDDDWFELYNADPARPVALGGLRLTDDLTDRLKFAIPPLSFAGWGDDGFVQFIADENPDAGADHVDFKLATEGESIGLSTASGVLIDSINFGPQANGVSEGRFPDGAVTLQVFPGTETPAASNRRLLRDIVISEVLARSDPPFEDAIELHNPGYGAVDLGGWFVSDSRSDARRFRIPDGTILQPGERLVFYEAQFNPDFGPPPSFSLDGAGGETVFLSTATPAGVLTGFRAEADFGAAASGVSWGRHQTSVGFDFTPLAARTFGADNPATVEEFRAGTGLPNAAPLVGAVVINEIMYHPPGDGTNDNTLEEFIELRNITGDPVPLFHTNFTTNTWRLRDAVDFDFPTDVTLPPNGLLLVVNFNPTNTAQLDAFRAKYSVDSGVPIYGPYGGRLGNDDENIELYRPDAPQPLGAPDAGSVPYLQVDRVRYDDRAPWASAADGNTNGIGASLQRLPGALYGNDPVNWIAGVPTAGAANGPAVLVPPAITSSPPDHAIARGATDTLTVTATGDAPLAYQWYFNGEKLAGATAATLVLPNMQATNAGVYNVVVSNPGGAAAAFVRITVEVAPQITLQPQSRTLAPGSTATFQVGALGTPPLGYQWRFNGTNLDGATGPILVLTNVPPTAAGNYTAVVTNAFGAATSTVAVLTLRAAPTILAQPQSTNVFVGATAVFTVEVVGSLPLRYQWRRNNIPINGATNATLTLVNVQPASAGTYSVSITNSIGMTNSAPATLGVTIPPVVSIAAPDSDASEPGANTGRVTVSRTGSVLLPLTVDLAIGGTATPGADYQALPPSVVIPTGSNVVSLFIVPVDDSAIEGGESVVLTIRPNPAAYVVGASGTAAVTLRDNDNVPPSIAITNPIDGALFSAPVTVNIGAAASDMGGVVTRVEFFYNGTNRIGQVTTPPYRVAWTNPAPGAYQLIAVATDDFGASAVSAPVAVTVNGSPTVAITNPVSGAVFNSPTNLTLRATAEDIDGTVTVVEFFEGATLLGNAASSPYSVTWSNPAPGNYALTARATDNRGAITVSTQVNVTVRVPVAGFADHFTNRPALSGFTNFITGSTLAFSREAGEPRHDNRNGTRSGWIQWTAPFDGPCTIDTLGSGFDTVLAVYTNKPVGPPVVTNLAVLASNDDASSQTVNSRLTFQAVAGRAYHVAVDAWSANQGGSYVFHLGQSNPYPVVVTHPQSQVVIAGAAVTFNVAAVGPAPLAYEWRFNGAAIFGASGPSLMLTNVQAADGGQYVAVVNNSSGSATSSVASLTVQVPPALVTTPQTVVVSPGGDAQFSASANGTPPITYQWRFNGVNIPGATNPAYLRPAATFTNGGLYSVAMQNIAGSAQSAPAELIVRPVFTGGTRLTNGAFRVFYNGTPGKGYVLESTLLATNVWTSVTAATNAAVAGQLLDPGATNEAHRLYRLRVGP
jgi:hypothetical protein